MKIMAAGRIKANFDLVEAAWPQFAPWVASQVEQVLRLH